jgi:hypothetical protein
MKQRCVPRWRKEPLDELYGAFLIDCATDIKIYVESLDGVCDDDKIARLLAQWGFTIEGEGLPIILDPEEAYVLVSDDGYCPGYDTIWVLQASCSFLRSPPFMTWYATESVGALPKFKDPFHDADWDVVGEWMEEVGALVGFSQGVLRLVLSLEE